jgi:mono/diheme cytochrome c family protein
VQKTVGLQFSFLYRRLLLTVCAVLTASASGVATVGRKPSSNPLAGNPAAIREGASLFRADCAPCHGLHAKGGGRGPSLASGRWVHGSSDTEIFHTITEGVPGTEMPANAFEDSETWAIIAYLRSLNATARLVVSGNDT